MHTGQLDQKQLRTVKIKSSSALGTEVLEWLAIILRTPQTQQVLYCLLLG